MNKSEILQKDSPVLRKVSKEVPIKDIESKKIKDILGKMKVALYAEEDGVAIAAPQVGENLRIFVVRGEVLTMIKNKNLTVMTAQGKESHKDLVFINPKIIKISKKRREAEEGCLSVRWLYGEVKRSDKVVVEALDENGKPIKRGASGLLAQIFQHEIDHLDGVLFIDKAKNLRDIPPTKNVKMVFFGGSRFSHYVLEELAEMGITPALHISSAKEALPVEKLKEIDADIFVVASFGKILPKEIINLPKHGTLNVHPSFLPKLRGATPIQGSILTDEEPGVTIIKMDEQVDHGPIMAQAKIAIKPWPDHYAVVEEKLGRVGGQILGVLIPKWINGEVEAVVQDDKEATFTKLIKKEDGLINLDDPAEVNYRKVLAYSTWPGAYMFYKNRLGKQIRLVVKDAELRSGEFFPTRVIPAGKKEMDWQDFLRGN